MSQSQFSSWVKLDRDRNNLDVIGRSLADMMQYSARYDEYVTCSSSSRLKITRWDQGPSVWATTYLLSLKYTRSPCGATNRMLHIFLSVRSQHSLNCFAWQIIGDVHSAIYRSERIMHSYMQSANSATISKDRFLLGAIQIDTPLILLRTSSSGISLSNQFSSHGQERLLNILGRLGRRF